MEIIRRIAALIKPYTLKTLLTVLFSVIGALFAVSSFTMIMPFLDVLFDQESILVTQALPWKFEQDVIIHNFKYILSIVIEERGKQQALMVVGLFMVVAVFFKTFFHYLSRYVMAPIRTGVVRDVRNKLYSKILRLHLGFFTEERKGDLISRMTNDVQEIENSVVHSLNNAIKAPITIIIFLIILVNMSPTLTIFAFILIPITGVLIGRIGKSLRRKSAKGQEKVALLLSYIEETLFGLRIIKAFNNESKINDRFMGENNSYTRLMKRIWRRKDLAGPLSEFLATTTIVVVMWYGGNMVLGEVSSLNPSTLIGYLAIFSQIITPSKDLSTVYYSVQKGMASLDRIDVVLNSEIAIKDKDNATSIDTFKESIEYKDVSFKYINDYVLKDINLTIEKGKMIALVGQSGSGKSTMVDLIPRFYDIIEGQLLIDGAPVNDLKLDDLRQLMGIVSQESVLFNDTIYNNIAFGKEGATMEDVIQAAKIANAHDFILQTEHGYETNIGDRGSKLSGGQRQRISIARAVLKNPPIMILDEATSALDTESEKLVQDALYKLMENRTSVVIAHRLSTIYGADEICVLHEGKIVERGKHDDLIKKNGTYKKLHDLQTFSE